MPITAGRHDRPRRRPADTTRRQLVARYHRSDLTQRAFCQQAGIPLSTLQWWLAKARRDGARDTPVTFAEVTVPEAARPDHDVGAAWAVEIITRTGVTLRLREPLARGDLVALLRGARC